MDPSRTPYVILKYMPKDRRSLGWRKDVKMEISVVTTDDVIAVSYTHLDVYKRQLLSNV